MTTLRIEHHVASYEGWKKAFDSDPINRKQSGVKRYRIYQPGDDERFVIIELDFEQLDQALATQAALQNIFPRIEGNIIFGVQMKILNLNDAVEL